METIDSVKINFNPDQLFWLNACLGFLMFGVALDLRLGHFAYVIRHPKASVIGLISQLLLLPVLTLLLIWVWQPPPSMALGMILVAACPGGNVSNYAVHLAGANAALSVTLTTVTTLAAAFITPISFEFFSRWLPQAAAIPPSMQVDFYGMLHIFGTLIVLPLALGMSLSRWLPQVTMRIQRPVRGLSMLLFLGFIVAALSNNVQQVAQYLELVFVLVLFHNGLALAIGYSFARATGLPRADVRAISMETGIQNSGLGLILIFNFFQGLGGMAMIAAWWGIWHLISGFTLAMYWKTSSSPLPYGRKIP